jgi:hypothetical protein
MPEAITDPFSKVYAAIAAALSADSDFARLVDLGLRIDFTQATGYPIQVQKRDRSLKAVSELDQGRFTLMPFGGNSRVAEASQSYVLSVDSHKTTVQTINQIKWAALKALRRAGPELGTHNLVRDWMITDGMDQPRPQSPDATAGWAAVLTIQVQMYFDKALIA